MSGLGPTIDIFPDMTLRSNGSASIRQRRKKRPSRVTRWNEDLLPVLEHSGLLRAQLEQCADRLRGAALRTSLELPPEEDERRGHRRDLEVRVGIEAADEDDGRPDPGRERAH